MSRTNQSITNDNHDIESLHALLESLADEVKTIEQRANTEQRVLTAAEQGRINTLRSRFDETETRIGAALMRSRVDEYRAPMSRITTDDIPMVNSVSGPTAHDKPHRSAITGGTPVARRAPSWGWRNHGEFMQAVFNAARGAPHQLLMNAATTFGTEGANQDGGFAVPPDFRQNIMALVRGDDSLMQLCDVQPTSSNALELPIDSMAPHDNTGGVLATWEGEGASLTQSKPKLGAIAVKLNKLSALVPMTDELLADAPATQSYLSTKVGLKFNARLNDAIVNGDGVGKPQGLLNAPSKITQAAESGQGAGTVVLRNILKMWARLPTGSRMKAVWLCHPDVEQQLQQLVMTGTNPNAGIFLPGGSLINAGASTLLGRPLVVTEACPALGTEGDIILTDLSQYLLAVKVPGMQSDVSIHVWFDQGVTAFRFIMRVGGQSYWPAPYTRQNGSTTASPIITLNSTRT